MTSQPTNAPSDLPNTIHTVSNSNPQITPTETNPAVAYKSTQSPDKVKESKDIDSHETKKTKGSLKSYTQGFVGWIARSWKILAVIIPLFGAIFFYLGIYQTTPHLKIDSMRANVNDVFAHPFEIQNRSPYFPLKDLHAGCLIPWAIFDNDANLRVPRLAECLGDVPPGDSIFFNCDIMPDPSDPTRVKKFHAMHDFRFCLGIEWSTLGFRRTKLWTLSIRKPDDNPAYWIVVHTSKDRLDVFDQLRCWKDRPKDAPPPPPLPLRLD